MEYLYQCARWLHIISGFTALLVFWLPIVTEKGRKLHIRSGWIFVTAMTSVAITAIYMGIYGLSSGQASDEVPFSWFLIFVSILSGVAAWYGIRVLRYKRRKASHRQPIDLLFPILLITSSIAIIVYGWVIGFQLLQYFPIIGLFLGGIQLQYWLSIPKRRSHWMISALSACFHAVSPLLQLSLSSEHLGYFKSKP